MVNRRIIRKRPGHSDSADLSGHKLSSDGSLIERFQSFARSWSDTVRMLAGALGISMIAHTWIIPAMIDKKPILSDIEYGKAQLIGPDRLRIKVRLKKNRCSLQHPERYTATWRYKTNKARGFSTTLYPVIKLRPSKDRYIWFAEYHIPNGYDLNREGLIELNFDYICSSGKAEIFFWPPMPIRAFSINEIKAVRQ